MQSTAYAQAQSAQVDNAFIRLGHAHGRTDNVFDRIRAIEEKLIGGRPAPDTRVANAPAYGGIIGALDTETERLNGRLSEAEDSLSRIEAALS